LFCTNSAGPAFDFVEPFVAVIKISIPKARFSQNLEDWASFQAVTVVIGDLRLMIFRNIRTQSSIKIGSGLKGVRWLGVRSKSRSNFLHPFGLGRVGCRETTFHSIRSQTPFNDVHSRHEISLKHIDRHPVRQPKDGNRNFRAGSSFA
jgi:hypothetical protein